MRLIIALIIACGVGCRSPESWVRGDSGKDPILCYREFSMTACRDSTGLFWICDRDNNAHCMRVDLPATLFAVKSPTPAEAAPK